MKMTPPPVTGMVSPTPPSPASPTPKSSSSPLSKTTSGHTSRWSLAPSPPSAALTSTETASMALFPPLCNASALHSLLLHCDNLSGNLPLDLCSLPNLLPRPLRQLPVRPLPGLSLQFLQAPVPLVGPKPIFRPDYGRDMARAGWFGSARPFFKWV
ncbi:hypothetical protein AAC387_Pa02g4477 [Persea americana]